MRMHTLQPNTKRKKKKIIGRGGKRGTYSGKGIKGQLARSGRKLRPELRDIIKKLPKLRGRGTNALTPIRKKPAVVSLDAIEKHYADGETVSPATLVEKGLVRKVGGRIPSVKILGAGIGRSASAFSKKLSFEKCAMSKTVADLMLANAENVKRA